MSNRQERKRRREARKAAEQAKAAGFALGGVVGVGSGTLTWSEWMRGARPTLPERNSDEPIKAYKHAWLAIERVARIPDNYPNEGWRLRDYDAYWPRMEYEHRFMFRPLNWGKPYGVESIAECVATRATTHTHRHRAPQPDCSCGFYAYKDYANTVAGGYGRIGVALSVELAGRIIVHQIGYRAEYQRVMRAVLYGVDCGHADVIDYERIDVTTFGSTSSTFIQGRPIHTPCGRPATYWRHDHAQVHGQYGAEPLFLCDHHAHAHDPRYVAPIGTLLDRLRTDLPTEWTTP